jgi:hypothetical protein
VETVAERLKRALAGRSAVAFQEEMKRRGVKGSSYPQVHRYLTGEVVPTVAWPSDANGSRSARGSPRLTDTAGTVTAAGRASS